MDLTIFKQHFAGYISRTNCYNNYSLREDIDPERLLQVLQECTPNQQNKCKTLWGIDCKALRYYEAADALGTTRQRVRQGEYKVFDYMIKNYADDFLYQGGNS